MPYAKKILDGRTKVAREISEMEKLVTSDLDATSVKILRRDISNLTVIGQLCLEKALSNPELVVDKKGNLSPNLSNYLKCQAQVKASLVALKKFDKKKSGGIGDLFGDPEDD
jgi:hypothetical protein